MSAIPAYPLAWPAGWPRTEAYRRTWSKFSVKGRGYANRELTINDGVTRVREELRRLGALGDFVISTNVPVRLDGYPRSDSKEPKDPGVAVYWRVRGARSNENPSGEVARCIAVDRYARVGDNLGAIAATIDAMRAIERHGGAQILERAFVGFTALAGPDAGDWRADLDLHNGCTLEDARAAYRRLASAHHPDRGGDPARMVRVNDAWKRAQEALGE